MNQSIKAGSLYFALIFALGFLLGTFRVLILVPRLGELKAVVLELPIMLVAAWFICRWLVHRYRVPGTASARLVMGAVAFAWLMFAEVLLSVAIVRMPFELYVQRLLTSHGLLGLAGQGLFAIIPMLQRKRTIK